MNGVSRSFSEYPALTSSMPENGPLQGASAAMQEVFRLIERVAPTEAGVLLTGENGTGKGLAARSIHECSARRGKAFISINCGAIPASLIEAVAGSRFEIWSTPTQDVQGRSLVEQILQEQGVARISSDRLIHPTRGMKWDEGIVLCSGAADT